MGVRADSLARARQLMAEAEAEAEAKATAQMTAASPSPCPLEPQMDTVAAAVDEAMADAPPSIVTEPTTIGKTVSARSGVPADSVGLPPRSTAALPPSSGAVPGKKKGFQPPRPAVRKLNLIQQRANTAPLQHSAPQCAVAASGARQTPKVFDLARPASRISLAAAVGSKRQGTVVMHWYRARLLWPCCGRSPLRNRDLLSQGTQGHGRSLSTPFSQLCAPRMQLVSCFQVETAPFVLRSPCRRQPALHWVSEVQSRFQVPWMNPFPCDCLFQRDPLSQPAAHSR